MILILRILLENCDIFLADFSMIEIKGSVMAFVY